MVIECSEVRYKFPQFLTTMSHLSFSLSLYLSLISIYLSLSISLFATSYSAPHLFHLKWGRGWFVSVPLWRRVADNRTTRMLCKQWANSGEKMIAEHPWHLKYLCATEITTIASISRSQSCGINERNSIMHCCFNLTIFLRFVSLHIIYPKIIHAIWLFPVNQKVVSDLA